MSMEKIFKNLILTNISIIFIYFISIFFIDIDYVSSEENTDFFLSDTILGIILIIWLVGYLYAHYLLYKFKPLGKKIFLPIILLNIVIYILLFVSEDMTSLLNSNYDVFVEWITGFISGCLVIFIYFTPIKDKFLKH